MEHITNFPNLAFYYKCQIFHAVMGTAKTIPLYKPHEFSLFSFDLVIPPVKKISVLLTQKVFAL